MGLLNSDGEEWTSYRKSKPSNFQIEQEESTFVNNTINDLFVSTFRVNATGTTNNTVTRNAVLTGLNICINSYNAISANLVSFRINGVTIIEAQRTSILGQHEALEIYIPFPDWEVSINSTLTVVYTLTGGGSGNAYIQVLGYYKEE